ncbi:MAG: transcriptional repressor, partial [Cyanobacteriota bacterium]
GTVYRNLEMLCDQGIIQKVETSSFQKRFDSIIEQHYHLHCTKCGKLEDSYLPLITGLEEEAKKICNYDITGHNIEFFGICPDCK